MVLTPKNGLLVFFEEPEMKSVVTFAIISASIALTSAAHAEFQYAITSGHSDLGVALEDGVLVPHIHSHSMNFSKVDSSVPDKAASEDGSYEFTTDEAYYQVGTIHATSRPSGSQWDFLGVAAGQTYYRTPSTNQTGKQYIGFGAEEIAAGSLTSYTISDQRAIDTYGADTAPWITWTLTAATFNGEAITSSSAGQFAMWTGNSSADPVWVTTTDGIDSSDVFWMQEAGHEHLNMGFSTDGVYEITFVVGAMVDGTMIYSDPATYTFVVGNASLAAVPEPAALATLGIGGLALLNRRKKQPQ